MTDESLQILARRLADGVICVGAGVGAFGTAPAPRARVLAIDPLHIVNLLGTTKEWVMDDHAFFLVTRLRRSDTSNVDADRAAPAEHQALASIPPAL